MRWIFIWHEVSPIQYLRKMDIFWLKIKLYSIYKPHSSHQTHKKYLLLVLNRFYKLVNPKARMSLIWRFRSSIVCKPPPPAIFSDWFHFILAAILFLSGISFSSYPWSPFDFMKFVNRVLICSLLKFIETCSVFVLQHIPQTPILFKIDARI